MAEYTICMMLAFGVAAYISATSDAMVAMSWGRVADWACVTVVAYSPANNSSKSPKGRGKGTKAGLIVSNPAWARMTAWWASNAVPQRENSMFFVNVHLLTVAVKSATPSCPTPPSLNAFVFPSDPAFVTCPHTPELEVMAAHV